MNVPLDDGKLVVTDQALYFGEFHLIRIPLDNIFSIRPSEKELQVCQMADRPKRQVFGQIDGMFAKEILYVLRLKKQMN